MKWKYEHTICSMCNDVFMRIGTDWGCDFHSCNKDRDCYYELGNKSCFYLKKHFPVNIKTTSSIPLVILIDEEVVK